MADRTANELAVRVRALDASWVAAPIWRLEFLNAAAGYLRRGLISAESLMDAYNLAARAVASFRPSYGAVAELLAQSTCTAYDLAYVQVARETGAPLVTFDREILNEFPGTATHPEVLLAGQV
ncbi:type II toxin-antitoxin system VapC family toxin [Tepidiforma thermophila]|uniref:type II toxin-antitoxin system VapC family toxin n=1 Tax=Tepidiforma thermophila (strain KCTC 52669 / CGMCC 1.13589 / G233) TaxID=2761530 RepID=UPI001054BB0A|nr:type II toxin-antitoxin system VapC family toxin [Tepidiforma thermophila]